MGKFPGIGTHKLCKCPGVGMKEEGKCPAAGIAAFQHHFNFYINQWIKRSICQYFNASVGLQGQQDMLVDYDYIYFLYILLKR